MAAARDDGAAAEGLRPSVLLTVAYDGRDFAGFAPQSNARTVASELLAALRHVDSGLQHIRGASRTDSGVHARGQRVAFDPTCDRPLAAWVLGSVKYLPDSIVVCRASSVPRYYAPRFDARWKRYRYLVLADGGRDPFLHGRVWRVPELRAPGALELAQAEARTAIGTHDFRAFRSARDPRIETTRTILDVAITRDGEDPRILRVDVRGRSFMHNMVRILVGTIVDVGRGLIEPGALARALKSGDRRDAGVTAPAEGLYLDEMELEVEESDVFVP